jgi:hydantoinase/carbamoylase family amidase
VNAKRLKANIEKLFELAPDEGGGATRLAYTPEEARAMLLVAEWLEEAGLLPRLDRFGNLWGLPPHEDGPIVTSGSHVDTVPNGGRYDGALGTVLAIEIATDLDGKFGVLVCAAEEAPRFGAGTLGSRQLVGKLSDEDLVSMRDADGVSALEARSEYLKLLSSIPSLEDLDLLYRVAAHVEVHIEQRRSLKEQGASVGIATIAAGPARYRFRFAGSTGHSGETRMRERRDALCAAAEVVLFVERLARKAASTVATVGTVGVKPNALTAIPSEVVLGLDVRGTSAEEMESLISKIMDRSQEISQSRGVDFSAQELSLSGPTALDERVVKLAEEIAHREHIPTVRCVSYAGHDAQHIAEKTPAALMFVASSNGVSHAPEEDVDREDLERVCKMLAALLPELKRNHGEGGR